MLRFNEQGFFLRDFQLLLPSTPSIVFNSYPLDTKDTKGQESGSPLFLDYRPDVLDASLLYSL